VDRQHQIPETRVEQVLGAGSNFAGEDELRKPDLLEADAPADVLVGIGGFFDDVSGEA